ncbi:MAG: RHS repeat-associated core domain-containing protein, partial [Bacteroidales bacterium]|nr:RHS repeat-associated core domain-containing protein [Bacteroidales bacterium]
LNANGTTVVHYVYDAYGNIIKTDVTSGYAHIAAINSYTYRGYRYDYEIGMYYLNSRYYNPEIGRLINSDGLLDLTYMLSTNLYIYCSNNPIKYIDPLGYKWIYNNFFELNSYNEIHIAVQNYLAVKHGLETEIKGADLFKRSTNEIWEVKPISYKYNPIKRALAYAQLYSYLKSISNSKIGFSLGDDNFQYLSKKGYTYIVEYYSGHDGLIFYKFKRFQENKQLSPEVVTITVGVILVGMVLLYMYQNGGNRDEFSYAYD